MDMKEILAEIAPLRMDAMEAAQARLDQLAKPPGSLGALEAYAVRLAGITGCAPPDISRRAILIFCADNGVCAEGIGSAPQSVTHAQTVNFARGLTGVAALARAASAALIIADVGVNAPVNHPGVRNLRVRAGTGNIRHEDAMTRQEAELAMSRGALLAREAAAVGYGLLGVGEMGIGNTATSTAVLSVLSGVDSDCLTGAGGGIGDARLQKKREVIRDALRRAAPDPSDVLLTLSQVGGLDLCAMTGAYLGAASVRLPVVIDGLIGGVAALAAARLAPCVTKYLFASHLSREPGAKVALDLLGLSAPLHLGLWLGEGSGCPLMFGLLDAACAVYRDMATFAEADINSDYLEDIRK